MLPIRLARLAYWEVLSPSSLPQLCSLVFQSNFHWQQYPESLFAAQIVVQEQHQQCSVAGLPEGSGAVVWKILA